MTVFMSRRHAYQAKLRHHFPERNLGLVASAICRSWSLGNRYPYSRNCLAKPR